MTISLFPIVQGNFLSIVYVETVTSAFLRDPAPIRKKIQSASKIEELVILRMPTGRHTLVNSSVSSLP